MNQNPTVQKQQRTPQQIKLQPLGNVLPKHIQMVEEALTSYYDCEVVRPAAIDLPKMAWYAPRKRYRADSLIRFLRRNLEPKFDRVIGLTTKDISTTKAPYEDWGIMGLAFQPGKACVVSTYRIKRGANGEQFKHRLRRVAKHEVGHSFGLPHCKNSKCFMRDANGKVTTADEEGDELCDNCKKFVGDYLLFK